MQEQEQIESINKQILETRKNLQELSLWEKITMESAVIGIGAIGASLTSLLFSTKVTPEMLKGILYLTSTVVGCELGIGTYASSDKVIQQYWQSVNNLITRLESLERRKKYLERKSLRCQGQQILPKPKEQNERVEEVQQLRSEVLQIQQGTLDPPKEMKKAM